MEHITIYLFPPTSNIYSVYIYSIYYDIYNTIYIYRMMVVELLTTIGLLSSYIYIMYIHHLHYLYYLRDLYSLYYRYYLFSILYCIYYLKDIFDYFVIYIIIILYYIYDLSSTFIEPRSLNAFPLRDFASDWLAGHARTWQGGSTGRSTSALACDRHRAGEMDVIQKWGFHTMWGPKIAKLVNITPITMVYGGLWYL